jgi:hypothetical protein
MYISFLRYDYTQSDEREMWPGMIMESEGGDCGLFETTIPASKENNWKLDEETS